MTKRKYKNKCRKLFDKAKALGVIATGVPLYIG